MPCKRTFNSRYDAFGNAIAQTQTVNSKYGFAGEQFDSNLGDYYLRDRFYDPQNGRFLRQDVYEGKKRKPLTLHKYSYAHNNPTNLTDPSGFTPQQDGDIIHSKIGLHFIREVGITETDNPMTDPPSSRSRDRGNVMFTRERVYDPRTPYTRGNRPSLGRVIKTALGNPSHPGVRGYNGSVYPDLVDFANHELYEIKPARNQQQIQSGINELTTARNALHGLGLTDWHLGDDYVPPTLMSLAWVFDNFAMNFTRQEGRGNAWSGKFAIVRSQQPGIIVYDIINPRIGDILSASLAAYAISQAISQYLNRLVLTRGFFL
ncbi:RHS repeat-associated core domain-containing protein [Leptolyngbya sp. GGD]|uniref:RHS repeat-associated core domain-containing protein n=1 Tax=Leptolyngbya sp. GGD TaxID=2997907 RepID=UPI00227AED90|nr:RHS repeat-associated core domain-containing protein [Leptolyngbya sp. GGD]MCY6493930.1 hypothetical protein [Leptolyngbya sp. GGD]